MFNSVTPLGHICRWEKIRTSILQLQRLRYLTNYTTHPCCRSDGIPTRIMFKVSHETRFPTLETCLFRCIRKFTVPYFRLLIDTTVSVSTALFASLSYGPIFVAVWRFELQSYGFKDRDNQPLYYTAIFVVPLVGFEPTLK